MEVYIAGDGVTKPYNLILLLLGINRKNHQ